jgi:hypothetical protein
MILPATRLALLVYRFGTGFAWRPVWTLVLTRQRSPIRLKMNRVIGRSMRGVFRLLSVHVL